MWPWPVEGLPTASKHKGGRTAGASARRLGSTRRMSFQRAVQEPAIPAPSCFEVHPLTRGGGGGGVWLQAFEAVVSSQSLSSHCALS